MSDESDFVICETCGEKVPAYLWGKSCARCVTKAVVKKVSEE